MSLQMQGAEWGQSQTGPASPWLLPGTFSSCGASGKVFSRTGLSWNPCDLGALLLWQQGTDLHQGRNNSGRKSSNSFRSWRRFAVCSPPRLNLNCYILVQILIYVLCLHLNPSQSFLTFLATIPVIWNKPLGENWAQGQKRELEKGYLEDEQINSNDSQLSASHSTSHFLGFQALPAVSIPVPRPITTTGPFTWLKLNSPCSLWQTLSWWQQLWKSAFFLSLLTTPGAPVSLRCCSRAAPKQGSGAVVATPGHTAVSQFGTNQNLPALHGAIP